MIGDSVVPVLEVAAVSAFADVRSVLKSGDRRNQRSKGGEDPCQEEKFEFVKARPSASGLKLEAVAQALAVAVPDQIWNGVIAKVGTMMRKLKAENVFLHGELVEERTTRAPTLADDIRLQRNRKTAL